MGVDIASLCSPVHGVQLLNRVINKYYEFWFVLRHELSMFSAIIYKCFEEIVMKVRVDEPIQVLFSGAE